MSYDLDRLPATIAALLLRELGAIRRAVEAYPDDASIWHEAPGLPNPGGTLVLHVAGNLQHYVGAMLGGTGYRRDRPAEFARRGVARDELLAEVQAAEAAVARGVSRLDREALAREYPEPVAGRTFVTQDFLLHLVSHTAYHLGQLDYHRRVVTGDATSIGAIAAAELDLARPPRG